MDTGKVPAGEDVARVMSLHGKIGRVKEQGQGIGWGQEDLALWDPTVRRTIELTPSIHVHYQYSFPWEWNCRDNYTMWKGAFTIFDAQAVRRTRKGTEMSPI